MKLKTKDLEALRRIYHGNTFPTSPSSEVDEAYEAEAAIQDLLEKERSRKGLARMSPARRAFYGVSTLNMYFKGDGLVTGVAINDPELLSAAIEGAKAMNLRKSATVLAKADRQLPPKVTWKNLRKREAWFETLAGKKAAAKLETLEEKLADSEEPIGFVGNCVLFALANPSEFFESVPNQKQ